MHNTHNHSHKLTKCFDRILIAITFFIVNTKLKAKGSNPLGEEKIYSDFESGQDCFISWVFIPLFAPP